MFWHGSAPFLGFLAVFAFSLTPVQAADLEQAPPSFEYQGQQAVPVDMTSVHIDYTFDAKTRIASGKARITFQTKEAGYPLFDLVPRVTGLRLNGAELDPSMVATTEDPKSVTRLRVLKQTVDAETEHTLEIDYQMRASDVTFSSGKIAAGFFMSDLANGGREYFEQYGPANLEYDQVHYTFNVDIVGTSAKHLIYTNGALKSTGEGSWSVDFPAYFTASSIYFHLVAENRFEEEEFTFTAMEKEIPVTIYASSSRLVRDAKNQTVRILKELESDYGGYYHDRLVIYVTSGGGGMEYCGATMTSMWALGHELTHSWFARGVMPADGRSGWIDEAIASWRDDGYPRPRSLQQRSLVNLSNFPPYRRHTPMASYSKGMQLISEFDYLFRGQDGMKPVLRKLFETYAGETITVDMFQSFLIDKAGFKQAVDSMFERYVYARGGAQNSPDPEVGELFSLPSHHPRPYTQEELRRYR